ncbi:MAG: trigger factor [Rhodospirillaceae bacterium BRH_c57]|nr:MAG: trigger factor [Rhodospirillaceae bacterium BRH_c57]
MQVTETNADGLKREFKIVVPASTLQDKTDSRLKELSHQVRLPGFRPGKVPMALMKKKYGASVMGEVLEAAVQEGSQQTLADRDLRPAMQPKIEIVSFEEGKDLEFKMDVEVLPTIGEMDFASIELERPKVVVPDAEIEEALGRIAESRKQAEATGSKRKSKKGDILEIDFVGRIGGEEFPGGKGEGYDLELGSNTFIPGFEDQLVGAKAGDVSTVTVTFPEDYHAKDLAGKEAAFEVTVKELKESKVPEINDDFAKTVGLEDLEALKAAVREQMDKDYAGIARNRVKRALLDKLADMADFEVPGGMVDLEFDAIWAQVEEAKAKDDLDEEDKGKSDEELRDEYRALAERRVRLGLLLAEIGQKNAIQVNQEDLNGAIMQEAMRYPGQEQAVFQFFQSNQQALNQLRAPIYEDKVVDYILELAQVTDKDVSPEELAAEPETAGTKKAGKKPAAKKKAAKKADDTDAASEGDGAEG